MSWWINYGELACCMAGWLTASILKFPTYYFIHKKINLVQAFGTGGMPSSHAALMVSTTLGIGLFSGFDTSAFALAIAVSMVVLYDAAGVRRQAGIHAERINMIINEIFQGKPIDQEELKEMLGHTPIEVIGGTLTGIVTALVIWAIWPK